PHWNSEEKIASILLHHPLQLLPDHLSKRIRRHRLAISAPPQDPAQERAQIRDLKPDEEAAVRRRLGLLAGVPWHLLEPARDFGAETQNDCVRTQGNRILVP